MSLPRGKGTAAAMPPLVVAMAGKPASSTVRAVRTSHVFTSRRGSPGTWSERRRCARSRALWFTRLAIVQAAVAAAQASASRSGLNDDLGM